MPQGLFGVVVGRRHVVDVEKGKDPVVVAFRVEEALAQVFGLRVLAWSFTDAVQRGVKLWAFGLCLGKGKLAGVPEPADFTGFGKEGARPVTKAQVGGTLQGRG